jgi:FkbM family methyltransferase
MTTLASTFARLLGDRPIGFVDIGARGGVHPLAEHLGAAVAVLGFEPDPIECARLRAEAAQQEHHARVEIEGVALAERTGRATLHELSAVTNTSLLPPNPIFTERYEMVKWREVGRSAIDTTTLDAVLFGARAEEQQWGEAIKIDTQGTEHGILQGAERTLAERTLCLCVEVSFCELYEGQKLFSDVELLLRRSGFSFYGFDRMFNRSRKRLDKRSAWGRERMIQADAYFFKDPFDPDWPRERSLGRRETIVLTALALVTGYHDFALELAERMGEDAASLRSLILAAVALPAQSSRAAVEALYRSVEAAPQDANVLAGKFVDERRSRNDYFDVT